MGNPFKFLIKLIGKAIVAHPEVVQHILTIAEQKVNDAVAKKLAPKG